MSWHAETALLEAYVESRLDRAAAFSVVDITSVHVAQAFRHRDFTGARERGRRSVGLVAHFEIGVKCAEVPRYIGAEIFGDPFGSAVQFGVAVVFAGNEKRGDLKPDLGVMA